MSTVLELIGFALIAAWCAFVFGWPASLLAAGIECLVLGLAADRPRSTDRPGS